ncbi:MAG: 1-deoxy-D-xylulose-5-phosphate reductoisomerase [Desulfuromonas sp.]|uniref:1-deoxy-D-xylulose-5-phosphate reductoisomerase n=1 Tax=Desulfuromonas sp. TaxID=892 RepID=UPI000CB76669|nr:1-deoxy-D-xylulose-5-phosphate reductoisomerase [Desulfuromonas sp.]PLX85092.1 MAG: 1-deoxy-D-xylulose-5-phosphate reductoisomerase [Desulfuromonas sp.]
MKNLCILGSTGSIGVSTLDIVAAHPERYRVVALTGGNNLERLREQTLRFSPKVVAVVSEQDALRLKESLGAQAPEILAGVEGMAACASHSEADMVVSAIVGAAGLVPTMAAIEAGKDVALANKETLVAAGPLVMEAVRRRGVNLFPVDSEHSAIFQSLTGHRRADVQRLILTASGGPFRDSSLEELRGVTPAQALAHPNWDMGRKISIDSATMMNKGLEVIEARWLFDLPADRIGVHIHPQSIVHSMVEYVDGSVIAQMGIPDMKTPIAYALSYPERLSLPLPPLDLCAVGTLTFDQPDTERFACLSLAYQALESGGTAPAVVNAANEVAVEAFLEGRVAFLQIPEVIRAALDRHRSEPLDSIEAAQRADRWGRAEARRIIQTFIA